MIVCQRCSATFEPSTRRGRPRKFCFDCEPPKVVERRAKVRKRCANCGDAFESVNDSRFKYCSRECRDRKVLRRACRGCGDPVWVSGVESVSGPMCRDCRAPVHGEVAMYEKRGCRCRECRDAKAESMRVYAAARRDSGSPIGWVAKPACDACGNSYIGLPDSKFCSADCAKRSQGWDGVSRKRWRPSEGARAFILERDGMTCQLCFSPLRPGADPTHPRYPNIDHIMPVARGGGNDESNLRAACRQCNVRRGANMEWVPEVMSCDGIAVGDIGVAV